MSKSEEAFRAYAIERYCACESYPEPNNQACICGAQQGHCPVHCGFRPDKPPHAPLEWSGWRACCAWHQRELRRMQVEEQEDGRKAACLPEITAARLEARHRIRAGMLIEAAEELKG
uniref:Uncharacterized protein n=1 Tax=viral metagenome TaxID=1070528 RepID=A0A6M3JIX5_9ZZZZ